MPFKIQNKNFSVKAPELQNSSVKTPSFEKDVQVLSSQFNIEDALDMHQTHKHISTASFNCKAFKNLKNAAQFYQRSNSIQHLNTLNCSTQNECSTIIIPSTKLY